MASSTKVSDDIPDVCGEEIFVGSEETVSVCSGDEQVLVESSLESDEEALDEGEMKGTPGPRGRADSGALLDMLAEVASQKLLFSPLKRDDRRDLNNKLSTAQIKGLSTNQLIDLFSTTEFDEMRKWYTYVCAFDLNCDARFDSFGNENRAKEKFKAHLFTHLKTMKGNDPLNVSKRPTTSTRRPRKFRKEVISEAEEEVDDDTEAVMENYNDEDEDDVDVKPKLNWTEDFILPEPENKSAGFMFEENGPKVEVEIIGQENEESTSNSGNVSSAVVDLNRLIAGLSEKMGVAGEHSYSSADSDVVFYVLEGDSMVVKSSPQTSSQKSYGVWPTQAERSSSDGKSEGECTVIRSAELPVIANNRSDSPPPASILLDPSAIWELNHGEHIERDEFRLQRKPKGKAKFIGQSKLEKQQALQAIEAIRTKTGGGLDTLQCTICQPPRTFTAPTTLISHYRSHAGIKPYECRVCSAVFTRQHSLNYHMLIHTNQTRFTCADCGRKFRHPSHFREHRRRHTGESPFECSDCLMRFKTRNTYKRHLRTRHGKVLTTSGGLIILSEDEFQMVKTAPRAQNSHNTNTVRRGRQRKVYISQQTDNSNIAAIDEDIQALHQLEIVTSNEGYEGYTRENTMDMDEIPSDFMVEDANGTGYEEIVREAVRLEHAEASGAATMLHVKEEPGEETLVIETEDPLSGSGLYLATLEDGETVLVNTRDDDSDDASDRVDLGFKLLEVGKVRRNSQQEPTVIVIKNESYS